MTDSNNMPSGFVGDKHGAYIRTDNVFSVDIRLTAAEVDEWMHHCPSAPALRHLAKTAIACAKEIEESDGDDFRSRA